MSSSRSAGRSVSLGPPPRPFWRCDILHQFPVSGAWSGPAVSPGYPPSCRSALKADLSHSWCSSDSAQPTQPSADEYLAKAIQH